MSFDVFLLFNNVPIGEAVSIIREKLMEDETLLPLLGTNCRVTGDVPEVYLLATMSSLVPAVLAKPLYTKLFEELALGTPPTRPRL